MKLDITTPTARAALLNSREYEWDVLNNQKHQDLYATFWDALDLLDKAEARLTKIRAALDGS